MTKRKHKSSPPSSPRVKRCELDHGTIEADGVTDLEAVFQGKKDTALYEQASATVDSLSETYMSALSMRSATRALAGKFADAHRDAELIITIAPSSAKGYLCKGKIYAMEGDRLRLLGCLKKDSTKLLL